MDKKVKGSWLIHHTQKLQNVTNQQSYEKTFLSGKAGILLSAISSDDETIIDNSRLEVLAKASNISTTFELPKLLEVLRQRELIDQGANSIAILGVTTASALQHTSDIFDALNPSESESAAINLAEQASIKPVTVLEAKEHLSDSYFLRDSDVNQVINDAEEIGFVDVEKLGNDNSLLFNGNLFKRDTAKKAEAVLKSLSPSEQSLLNELTEELKKKACIPVDSAKFRLGDPLFLKVMSIGLFDINVVSNSKEEVGFLTLPSAFSKYSNPMVEDAFDLTKAFISSITYGMTKSPYYRGQIQAVNALLRTLVRGESIGPVDAIAEDYKVLELKGVVQVHRGTKKGRTGPMLRLLKKEVGELALQAIQQGDVSEHSLQSLPNAVVTMFSGPESNREKLRRKQVKMSPKATNDMISVLRTGGGF